MMRDGVMPWLPELDVDVRRCRLRFWRRADPPDHVPCVHGPANGDRTRSYMAHHHGLPARRLHVNISAIHAEARCRRVATVGSLDHGYGAADRRMQ
jgi:hypothetical protein